MSQSITVTKYGDLNPVADAGQLIIGVGVAFLSAAIISVILRISSRIALKTRVALDDALCLVTLFFVTLSCAINLWGVNHDGWGRHVFTLTSIDQLHRFLKGLYVFEIAYTISTAFVRFTVIALYYRMFRRSAVFSRVLIAISVLNAIWVVVVTLLAIFTCSPVDGFWLFEKPSTCLNSFNYFIGSASANIVLEVLVISTPIPVVYRLQMSRIHKFAVSCVIMLGALIPIVAAFRLNELLVSAKYNTLHTDPTYSLVGGAIWSMIEICVGVIVSCLPCIRPLVRHVIKSTHNDSSEYSDRSRVSRREQVTRSFQNKAFGPSLCIADDEIPFRPVQAQNDEYISMEQLSSSWPLPPSTETVFIPAKSAENDLCISKISSSTTVT